MRDPHALAEARSLAFHRAVADRLRQDPTSLQRARAKIAEWRARGDLAERHADAWQQILDGSLESIVEAITDPSQRAAALRQCTPFAGFLPPEERWAIWARVRDEVNA